MVIFAKWNNAKVSRRGRQGSEPETKMTKDKGSDFSFVSVFFFSFYLREDKGKGTKLLVFLVINVNLLLGELAEFPLSSAAYRSVSILFPCNLGQVQPSFSRARNNT